jgi:hypothetical protein
MFLASSGSTIFIFSTPADSVEALGGELKISAVFC